MIVVTEVLLLSSTQKSCHSRLVPFLLEALV